MRILICPLDWGLGHATRCIPLIRSLDAQGHSVFVAASGAGHSILQREFPQFKIQKIQSFSMRYSENPVLLPIFLLAQLPQFLLSMWRDYRIAKTIVVTHGIDRIISDGRYGFRVKNIQSFFITHQLNIIPPGPKWLSILAVIPIQFINRFALSSFQEIWVPDFPSSKNLSGKLGHPAYSEKIKYIGPLCRFRPDTMEWNQSLQPETIGIPIDILALVSGPEPQRSLFETKLLDFLEFLPGTRVLVRGLPGKMTTASTFTPGVLNVLDHLDEVQLLPAILHATQVICRSGYTSIMEMAGLAKKQVIMVPTPGQPEQEYLASHLKDLGIIQSYSQDQIKRGMVQSKNEMGFSNFYASPTANISPIAIFLKAHPLLSVL